MKRYILPRRDQWSEICSRPAFEQGELTDRVSSILEKVKKVGDQALFNYTEELDGVRLQNLLVTKDELEAAADLVSDDLKNAIQSAKSNIEKFHSSQKDELKFVETTEGVLCWRKSVAIEKVCLYIPGGSAPLFSTILMLGIPATLAGCREVILCTPPDKDGKVNPAILYTANLVGISKIVKIGGAQAIAAMAFGTESVQPVYKIFGPGNQFVTKAKELIQITRSVGGVFSSIWHNSSFSAVHGWEGWKEVYETIVEMALGMD